jgi:hypothetical protein
MFVGLNSRLGKAKPVTLKCLLDRGASGSLISKEHAKGRFHLDRSVPSVPTAPNLSTVLAEHLVQGPWVRIVVSPQP